MTRQIRPRQWRGPHRGCRNAPRPGSSRRSLAYAAHFGGRGGIQVKGTASVLESQGSDSFRPRPREN
jgi:hypothetical protein